MEHPDSELGWIVDWLLLLMCLTWFLWFFSLMIELQKPFPLEDIYIESK